MKELILYTTVGCHLCEQALELIEPVLEPKYQIVKVDISDSDDLINRYGIRIPVVARSDNGAEIGWPFDQQQFLLFID
ncbi:MAG: glutaredoxin family protein [Oceanicoccus sp.]|uniref:glutaredoxin family protein n=1 Tax=Oceanicoccus sp. TaxID=2691044 RepID=UPI00261ACC2E|nr:glutaredoxin family protein [Oceanicoccus sp.]MDG1773731.1 glutaredoxin family protein [Oceanicoccus sp.]